jgi:hypothetical protein
VKRSAVLVVLLAAACTASTVASTAPTTSPTATTAPAAAPSTLAASAAPVVPPPPATAAPVPTVLSHGALCHARAVPGGVLPDAACTSGATNPGVTQATIGSTICRSGYTATIRPPASYTDALKRQQIAAYTDTSPRSYEEDHLISLELGGASSDQRNLWPEPGTSPNPKDKVENELHRRVCVGSMPLAEAQQRIATYWTTAAG